MSYISYVGKRDYLTGKFRVIGMSQELNDELKDELEEFCLELISKDTGSAIAINSLTNGKYTVEMAKRIEEPKTLTDTNGVLSWSKPGSRNPQTHCYDAPEMHVRTIQRRPGRVDENTR